MAGGEHFDVLVVGAGISGIGAGYHLQTMCPDRSFAILEGREDLGGTWDLFRYPGVRSDSDMHTLGFRFKPWTNPKAIADGPSILEYLRETAQEFGIDRKIRFRHRVTRADWSSHDARWTVQATLADTGETVSLTCGFLFMCSGYYSYKGGHTPHFEGRERFGGEIVHPQEWPEDLDYHDKRVVIIGSGATAITLVPAMAEHAAHVTMLQRSPTYIISMPDKDVVANTLGRMLPARAAYWLTRAKNARLLELTYKLSRNRPEMVKKWLLGRVKKELGPDYDVDTHFTPRYGPWEQRLCLVPNSDLFASIRSGKASVVTGHIETFTEKGVRLQSGDELPADIIVTATGLTLVAPGETAFSLDGEPIELANAFTYKGFMVSDVPNLASSFGYINASWTLRSDLICEHVCRLLNHMQQTGTDTCTPRLRPSDRDMAMRPFVEGFTPNYIQRALHLMPKQGDRAPWLNTQSYAMDKKLFRKAPVDDGVMQFTRSVPAEQAPAPASAVSHGQA